MKPYNTLKSVVFTITTAFVFFAWTIIQPILQSNPVVGLLLGGIISLGTYRFFLQTVEWIFLNINFIKRKIFGNQYLEGIWVGCYLGIDGQPRFFIEYFEQTFEGLVIRGKCFAQNDIFKGSWVSEKVVIDEEKGMLFYTYETDMVNTTHKNQGFAVFNFVREKKSSSPKILQGFSSDIFASKKLLSIEKKVEPIKSMNDNHLLGYAHELYEEYKNAFGI